MSDRYTVRDFADGVSDLAKGARFVAQWLALVAAIAVGTCAGLALFALLVFGSVAHNVGPFTPPTTEAPTTTSQP